MRFNTLSFNSATLLDEEGNIFRKYIDFIIDGVSLAYHLGGISDPVTPYGWGTDLKQELKEANRLISFKKSDFDNGLQSAYVCSACGDEGCGAIMFDVINHGSYAEWNSFASSDGDQLAADGTDLIKAPTFVFEIGHYSASIGRLKSLIK